MAKQYTCHVLLRVVAVAAAVVAGGAANVSSVVILGGTGDLASRYLWRALLEAVCDGQFSSASPVIAASRAPELEGSALLRRILAQQPCVAACGDCSHRNATTLLRAEYASVREDSDYAALGARLAVLEASTLVPPPARRLVYLSIPPAAHRAALASVATYLRPSAPRGDAGLVVAIEKPWTAESVRTMRAHLGGGEAILVDHYLAKPGVAAIAALAATPLASLLTRRTVARVEVVLREAVDCQGRAGFYVGVGAVRDMLQSHATAVLATALSLRAHGGTPAPRLPLLRSLLSVNASLLVAAQYEGFLVHACPPGHCSPQRAAAAAHTPTFAAAVMQSTSPDWAGVPLVLATGKAAGARHAFVRFVGHAQLDGAESDLTLHIQGGPHGGVAMVATGAFADAVVAPRGWVAAGPIAREAAASVAGAWRSAGAPARAWVPSAHSARQDAYRRVFDALLTGNHATFVSAEEVAEQWRVWDAAAAEVDARPELPRYAQGTDPWGDMPLPHAAPLAGDEPGPK